MLLQVISIEGALDAYYSGNYEQAYSIVFSIEDTTGFYQDEITEYRAFYSMHTGRYKKADSLYQLVLNSEYDSIRYKAYLNYAELQHLTFNFDKRLRYLQKAFQLKPTPQLIRIIARHYFQIEADYEKAQQWIDRHPTPQTDKDQAGFDLLRAEFAESKRQYTQAIAYYQQAKISAQKAGLFNYELFSAQGLYRASQLKYVETEERVKYWLEKIILALVIYFYVKYKTNERTRNRLGEAN